jgi:predicted DNA-binding transcriptional regulator AlpA
MRTSTHTTFDDLPDVALIQMRPLINFKVIPYSATTIWRKCRSGEFPSPIKVSAGITAWRVGDIREYLEALGKPSKGGKKMNYPPRSISSTWLDESNRNLVRDELQLVLDGRTLGQKPNREHEAV